tara:strand:+ start:422 stop:2302 length:1881 start_codon:yes stop_codon:yes gene_type:complete
MIKKISVENFRGFKDHTEFNLAPITVLTGTNNSGKSSFLKLLDLLKSNFSTKRNFDELNFESGNHNLGTFDKVLNWDNDSNEVKITLELNLDYFDEDFKLELSYDLSNETGKINSFKIFNKNRVLFRMSNFSADALSIDSVLDISYLKKIYNQNTICKDEKYYSPKILKEFKDINKKLELEQSDMKNIDDDLTDSKKAPKLIKFEDFVIEFYKKEYDILGKKEYPLFDINKEVPLFKGAKGEEVGNSMTIGLQKNFFESINLGNMVSIDNLKGGGTDNLINNMFIEGNFNFDNYRIQYNKLFVKLMKKSGLEAFQGSEEYLTHPWFFFTNYQQVKNFDKYFVKNIGRALKNIQFSFESIDIISATRGNKNRVLANKSLNDIDAIAKEFKNSELSYEDISFIENSLLLLNIKGEIKVKRIEGVASVVYIKQGNKKIALSDLGYGYSQVVPILLKIILVNKKNSKLDFIQSREIVNSTTGKLYDRSLEKEKFYSTGKLYNRSLEREKFYSTIIIEEPEANLHPNLQSKLADVLVLAHKTYGLHFILESHSEYLIRKLQYLTAKKEIAQNDVLIYYFNADEYVNEKELKVKEIKIDEFGALTDSFGPGFFDEATSLKFELMKLNQAQNN